eukprot:7386952-Prymnesium_polylepis.1
MAVIHVADPGFTMQTPSELALDALRNIACVAQTLAVRVDRQHKHLHKRVAFGSQATIFRPQRALRAAGLQCAWEEVVEEIVHCVSITARVQTKLRQEILATLCRPVVHRSCSTPGRGIRLEGLEGRHLCVFGTYCPRSLGDSAAGIRAGTRSVLSLGRANCAAAPLVRHKTPCCANPLDTTTCEVVCVCPTFQLGGTICCLSARLRCRILRHQPSRSGQLHRPPYLFWCTW